MVVFVTYSTTSSVIGPIYFVNKYPLFSFHKFSQCLRYLNPCVRRNSIFLTIYTFIISQKTVLNTWNWPTSISLYWSNIIDCFIQLCPVLFYVCYLSIITSGHCAWSSIWHTLELKNLMDSPLVILRLNNKCFRLDELVKLTTWEALMLKWVFFNTLLQRHMSLLICYFKCYFSKVEHGFIVVDIWKITDKNSTIRNYINTLRMLSSFVYIVAPNKRSNSSSWSSGDDYLTGFEQIKIIVQEVEMSYCVVWTSEV